MFLTHPALLCILPVSSKVQHHAATIPKYTVYHLLQSFAEENSGVHVCAQMQGILASPGVVSDQ